MNTKNNDEVKILVVDDNAVMCETLNDILSEEGYKITCVGLLASAKKELREKYYDVALVDITLPDGLGTDLLYEIENQKKKTKVIIITGAADIENAIFAVNNGAFAYLRKPVNMEILKKYINKALSS